ncbi:MAG: sugar-binding domain-containing protein [Kiritimatiellia bacterium]
MIRYLIAGLLVVLIAAGTANAAEESTPDIAVLLKAVESGDSLARRSAARKLLALGKPAQAAIMKLTTVDDVVIRRAALRRVTDFADVDAMPILKQALSDASPLVRLVAVEELAAWQPRTTQITDQLKAATQDEDQAVKKSAAAALWSFHRDVVPLRKRPDWDHAIEIVTRLQLPSTGWKFHTDPARIGHVQNWFNPQFDAKEWHDISTGILWGTALPKQAGSYEGVAWYRTAVSLPQKPAEAFNAVVLHFEAVDESTWLWINGHYAGAHDLGMEGWNIPFDIDIAPFVRWGETNHIAVRVLNAAGAGGIYKPVEFQVLK